MKFTFTVFTPTYNRATTLHRVYESLADQTFRNFEWLVVDDGSQDATEDLVHQWQEKGSFSIRYIRQENGGKHTAFNRGVQEARGALLTVLDSDDRCVPNALERFLYHWNAIPTDKREMFGGVTCLCMDESGDIVGDRFPSDIMDLPAYAIESQYRVGGEKWGFLRVDLLRNNPYPVIPGEKFVPESLIWYRVARHHKVRAVNEALRIYVASADGLTSAAVATRAHSPHGTRLYYRECAALPASWRWRIRNLVNYVRFSLHARCNLQQVVRESGRPVLTTAVYVAGLFMYLRDIRALARTKKGNKVKVIAAGSGAAPDNDRGFLRNSRGSLNEQETRRVRHE